MYRGEYGLVGSEMSMFTRKLEAQLRFQHIPWYWHFKTQERTAAIEARTGTHFIPALITPEKWMIHDTIALGPLLNDRFHQTPGDTADTAATGILLYTGRCIQSLAGARLCTYPLVLSGQRGLGGSALWRQLCSEPLHRGAVHRAGTA